MKNLLIFTICFLAIFNKNSFTQISVSSALTTYFNDNLYRSPQKISDFIMNLEATLAYQSTTHPLSMGFTPDFYFYREHQEQNFAFPEIFVDYFPYLDQEQKWQLYASLAGLFRINKETYNTYNFQQYQAQIGVSYNGHFALQQFLYQYQLRNYNNFSELNNVTHYLNWKFNKSFKTRTTLITNLNFATRTYQSQNTFIMVTDTVFKGKHRGGKGYGREPQIISQRIPVQSSPISLRHFSLSLRIAQNIFNNFGLYVQYFKSFDLSSAGSFQNYGSYLGDEELFDDPLSYLSNEWTTQITWVLAHQWQLKWGSSFNQKNYIKEKAYLTATDSIATGDLRRDQKFGLFISLKKSILIKEKFSLLFEGQIFYVNNRSNSYWYQYKNFVFGLGINLSY